MGKTIYICIVTILLGCKNNNISAQNSGSFNKFKSVEKLSPKPFINFLQDRGVKMYVSDSALIVRNANATCYNYHFYIYNINTKKLTDSLFKLGSNKTEILSAFGSGVVKNKLWAYDITTQKVVIGTLNTKPNEKQSDLATFNIKRPSFFGYYSVQLNDSLNMLANGDYSSKYKIQQINLANGKLEKEFGTYYDQPKDMAPTGWRGANESFLFLQPNNEKLIAACRYADKIEIFDLKTNKSKIIVGPENYQPLVEVTKRGDIDFASRNEKTRFAFVGGCVTNKYIYLSYSGGTEMTPNSMYGKLFLCMIGKGIQLKNIIYLHIFLVLQFLQMIKKFMCLM